MRVSDVLSACGLVDPWWFTQVARDRGNVVHFISESVFTEQQVDVAPEFSGYALALRRVKDALPDLQVLHVERRMHHPFRRLNGRPDVVGVLQRPVGKLPAGPVLIDVKSGTRLPSHAVQLSLYEMLAELDPTLPRPPAGQPWTRLGAYVKENGRYRLHRYDEPTDRVAAEAALFLTEWRCAHGLAKISHDNPDDPAAGGPGLEPDNHQSAHAD